MFTQTTEIRSVNSLITKPNTGFYQHYTSLGFESHVLNFRIPTATRTWSIGLVRFKTAGTSGCKGSRCSLLKLHSSECAAAIPASNWKNQQNTKYLYKQCKHWFYGADTDIEGLELNTDSFNVFIFDIKHRFDDRLRCSPPLSSTLICFYWLPYNCEVRSSQVRPPFICHLAFL